MNFTKNELRLPPHQGAVLEADDKTWYNDQRGAQVKPILNHKGVHQNSVFLVPNLITTKASKAPVNLYTCEICYGTGDSPIWTPEMHAKRKNVKSDEPSYQHHQPLKCTACAGKGAPPISIGELR
jgi:hypothetical protein